MKTLSCFLAFFLTVSVAKADELYGSWDFVGFSYEGKTYPPPNPDLHIVFSFATSGENTLIWWRTGEPGFCERKASYLFDGTYLTQEITWVNPGNLPECAQDWDMQLGRKSRSKIEIQEPYLHLYLSLDDKDLIYIFKILKERPL